MIRQQPHYNELLDLLRDSDHGRQLLSERRERHHATRKAAAEAIAAACAQRDRKFPKAQKAFEKASTDRIRAIEALREADAALKEAYRGRAGLGVRCESACKPHEKLLRETADPAIDELLEEVSSAYPDSKSAELNTVLLASLKELRELWREPLTDNELQQRLGDIRERCGL